MEEEEDARGVTGRETPERVPFVRVPNKYPFIDADPLFSRVVRYFRWRDIAECGVMGGLVPGYYCYKHYFHIPQEGFPRSFAAHFFIGGVGAFMLAYQRSCLRFYGLSENAREVERDRQEYLDARRRGLPHHLGSSEMPPHVQHAAARNTRYSGLKLLLLPVFNFSRHNLSVNWDLYEDAERQFLASQREHPATVNKPDC